MTKTIKMPTDQLLGMIDRIKSFAGGKNDHPAYAGVHLETVDGALWAEATNRYVVGGVKGPRTTIEINALIDYSDVNRLCYLLRWFKGGEVELRQGEKTEAHEANLDIALFAPEDRASNLNLRLAVRTDFPPIRTLGKPEADTVEPDTRAAIYDTGWLAKVAKLAPAGILAPNGEKPSVFVSEDAWALIQPMRIETKDGENVWKKIVKELNNG